MAPAGTGSNPDSLVYSRRLSTSQSVLVAAQDAYRDMPLSPAVRAAILRYLGDTPGLELSGRVPAAPTATAPDPHRATRRVLRSCGASRRRSSHSITDGGIDSGRRRADVRSARRNSACGRRPSFFSWLNTNLLRIPCLCRPSTRGALRPPLQGVALRLLARPGLERREAALGIESSWPLAP
jgi:hypothetical protein